MARDGYWREQVEAVPLDRAAVPVFSPPAGSEPDGRRRKKGKTEGECYSAMSAFVSFSDWYMPNQKSANRHSVLTTPFIHVADEQQGEGTSEMRVVTTDGFRSRRVQSGQDKPLARCSQAFFSFISITRISRNRAKGRLLGMTGWPPLASE